MAPYIAAAVSQLLPIGGRVLMHHGSSRGMIGSDTTTECSMGARLSAVWVKTFSVQVEQLH